MGRTWHVALAVVLVLHACAAATQPVLAGMMLDGDVDAIRLHGVLGSTLPLYGMVSLPLALLFWRPRLWRGPRHGPWWPAAVIPPLFFLEGTQIGLGHTRDLGLHIPFGVTIVVTTALMAVWVVRWRPAPADHAPGDHAPGDHAPGGFTVGGSAAGVRASATGER